MANVGIDIKVTNTVLGVPPDVNANSILFVIGAESTDGGDMAFRLGAPYLLRSVDDLKTLGIDTDNNLAIVKQVRDFYRPTDNVDNTGTILWLVGASNTIPLSSEQIVSAVRETVINGFQYRPRNIIVAELDGTSGIEAITPEIMQTAINELYAEGFATVALIPSKILRDITAFGDMSSQNAPMVGVVAICDEDPDVSAMVVTGKVGGYMASLSVGTSIGDASLPPFADTMYMACNGKVQTCATLSLDACRTLGEKQLIFARTRAPKNGLWLNDGATAVSADTALSTLESGRVIASMVDDLRMFFTPYLNNRIPVNNEGDIQSTYKQVVLNSARDAVVSKYVENGDISDARISLVARDNDMVGTRTWEVTLSILPAPTLRWIDGFVFYVKKF